MQEPWATYAAMKPFIILAACALGGISSPVRAAGGGTHITAPEALTLIKSGNARFVSGQSIHPRLTPERMQETTQLGQKPFATVLASSDSRVPVETVMDQGIGDLFVIRVAGNVVDVDEAGSIEFAVGHLDTPLLVVMGNTRCPAVAAAVEGSELGENIMPLVAKIVPAVERAQLRYPNAKDDELVQWAVQENIGQSITDILDNSLAIAKKVEDGKLMLVGALYEVHSGQIRWMSKHPQVRMLETRGERAREKARSEAEAAAKKLAPRPAAQPKEEPINPTAPQKPTEPPRPEGS